VPLIDSNAKRCCYVAAALSIALTTRGYASVGLPPAAGDSDPYRHILALQEIATANGGNRAAGTAGYDQSAEYVAEQLRRAGYTVRFEEFSFPFFEERTPPVLVLGPARPEPFTPASDALRTLLNSGSGETMGRIQPVDLGLQEPLRTSTSGCELEDFTAFEPGRIALVRRGTCAFETKVEHAQSAGASGVIIMNQGTDGQTGTFAGRLGKPGAIPVVGVTTELGIRLNGAALSHDGIEVQLKIDVASETRTTRNVIAEREPITGPFIVVGAHLDSVPEGPGMNDNASGSAGLLETALRLATETQNRFQVRFAFWGAEERGLLGSRHHLDSSPEEERRRIGLYINLDMVGSPNFGRFIQLTQRAGSGIATSTTEALAAAFKARGLSVEERAGRGRGFGSDDASFASKEIPAIGLYTGAGEQKSEAYSKAFGGAAGQPFDPCYHKACDTAANVNQQVLDEIADALIEALSQVAGSGPG
jgi:Zn-dependent M28 family amino/carboxypeptidase